jgi:hypothetical protein
VLFDPMWVTCHFAVAEAELHDSSTMSYVTSACTRHVSIRLCMAFAAPARIEQPKFAIMVQMLVSVGRSTAATHVCSFQANTSFDVLLVLGAARAPALHGLYSTVPASLEGHGSVACLHSLAWTGLVSHQRQSLRAFLL